MFIQFLWLIGYVTLLAVSCLSYASARKISKARQRIAGIYEIVLLRERCKTYGSLIWLFSALVVETVYELLGVL